MRPTIAVVVAFVLFAVAYAMMVAGFWGLEFLASQAGVPGGPARLLQVTTSWFLAPAAAAYVAIAGAASIVKNVATGTIVTAFLSSVLTLGVVLLAFAFVQLSTGRTSIGAIVGILAQLACIVIGARLARESDPPPSSA